MLNYAVCEISGKQYLVTPDKNFTVAFQKEEGDKIEASALLLSEDGELKIGDPYLKEKITLKRVEDFKGEKIRVCKFHHKANFRRHTGFRAKLTKVVLEGNKK